LEPAIETDSLKGLVAQLRRLVLVELPFSATLYIVVRVLSGQANSPSNPFYLLLVSLTLMLGVLSSTLNMLAAIVTIERLSTLALAAISALTTVGGAGAAAIAFSPTDGAIRGVMLVATFAALYILAYNMVKVFELMAERKPIPRYWATRRGLRP